MPRTPAATSSSGNTTAATVEAVWRIESARLTAALSRLVGDLGLAEDMAQDALVIALETWPETGVPENPAAWLMTTARNRGIDRIRRDRNLEAKYGRIAVELERQGPEPGPEEAAFAEDAIGDDVLTLIFTACHPALTSDSQVALILKTVAGLSTGEIARALLVSETTVAQRIVRAKRTLSEAGVQFAPPGESDLAERLATVLGVVYLIFNEGYAATAGESWMRADLSAEALRLGRILAGLAPAEPEVHGLVSLMEIQASRFPARSGPDGEPVLLMDQDRSQWDRLLVRRGLERLELARQLGGKGPYFLQAEIAACHARAVKAEETDWNRIVAHYDALLTLGDSPVTELNRAVAVAMAGDPDAALAIVDRLAKDKRMAGYHLLPAVRGDLLEKLDRDGEARNEFRQAAKLTRNQQEQRVLAERADRTRKFSG